MTFSRLAAISLATVALPLAIGPGAFASQPGRHSHAAGAGKAKPTWVRSRHARRDHTGRTRSRSRRRHASHATLHKRATTARPKQAKPTITTSAPVRTTSSPTPVRTTAAPRTTTTAPTTTPAPTAPTTPTTPTSSPTLGATYGPFSTVPFSATGPWRTTLPDDAPLDPNSSAIGADIAEQVRTHYGAAALNTDAYSAPIYTVPATQPTVTMTWSNCQHKSWEDPTFAAALRNVPIPANAVPSNGTDSEIVIWQPSTDTEWEFWVTSETNGVWSACWGGRIQNVSQNPGIFSGNTGATASGLPLLGFLVRVQDLQSGSIDHAINLELPNVRAGAYSWPAMRTDGTTSNPDDPAEGERLRLPASLDLSTLHLSAGELMIARAMQRYGLIVTDKSGSVAIQGEDPRPFELGGAPNPYLSYFSGWEWLQDLPWQDLQAVVFNYGKPGT